jgi:ATP-dependent RNA helicase RhlE
MNTHRRFRHRQYANIRGKRLVWLRSNRNGKTAAFAIPILQTLHKQRLVGSPESTLQALVLTPTRELAAQVAQSFKTYGRYTQLRTSVIFVGVGQATPVAAL